MAESTLSLTRATLRAEVGEYLGWAYDAADTPSHYDTDQLAKIDRILAEAYRRFISIEEHDWNFLKPVTTLEIWGTRTGTVSGQGVYASPSTTITVESTSDALDNTMVGRDFTFDTSGTSYVIVSVTSATILVVTGNASGEASGDTFTINSEGLFQCPDDFGGMDGDMHFDEDDETTDRRIRQIPQGQTRQMRAQTDSGGRPRFVSVEPKSPLSTGIQRSQWVFFPIPNQEYVATYRKVLLLDDFSATILYHIGGMGHSSTFRAGCLAVAEEFHERMPGLHARTYEKLLRASIRRDKLTYSADTFGYMGNGRRGRRQDYRSTGVTFEGTEYVRGE